MSQRVADVCLRALAEVAPDRVGAASQGTMNNVLVGGDGWVYYETIGGGQGGRPGRAGMSGVHTNMTNTRDTPVEAFERALPDACAALRDPAGERWRRSRSPAATGSSATSRRSSRSRVSLITERRGERAVGARRRRAGRDGRELAAPRRRRVAAPSASATR